MKNIEKLIDSTLANVPFSPITLAVMNWKKGAALPIVTWASEVKPAAEFKDIQLSKQVSAVLKGGICFGNMKQNANRETGPLPWGTWEVQDYTIAHNGQRYVRFTPSPLHKPSTRFFADGKEISREDFAAYLQPAEAKKLFSGEIPACFNVKESGLLGLGEIEA